MKGTINIQIQGCWMVKKKKKKSKAGKYLENKVNGDSD